MDFQELLYEDFQKIWEYKLPWENLDNTTILVTGASGLIGSFFVYALLNRNLMYRSNIHIIALARDIERLQEKFGAFLDVEIIVQDVCNTISYDKNLDFILHAACDVQPKTKALNPVGTCKTTVEGTIQVCELAQKKHAKIILLSSIGVYGKARQNTPFGNETLADIDLADSSFSYNEGKRMSEMICASYAKQYGLHYSTLRIGRVYGPTMNKTDSMVLSSFLFEAVNGNELYLKSDGKQHYSYVYVADVMAAIFILMFKGKCTYYNCGEGNSIEQINLGKIVEIIAKENHVPMRKINMNISDKEIYSSTAYCVMTSDLLIQLGWQKLTDIEQGIRKTSQILKHFIKGRQ